MFEVTIKQNGGIWRIHKCDPDDVFPCDPHADRVDKKEKLNLYNGEVFSLPNKIYDRTLSPKEMRYIYNQIMNSKETEIKNKLKVNSERITYL